MLYFCTLTQKYTKNSYTKNSHTKTAILKQYTKTVY